MFAIARGLERASGESLDAFKERIAKSIGWNRLMVIDKDDPALSDRAGELAEIGQACIDWFTDTGSCHFCDLIADPSGDLRHHDDCPVGAFLTRHRPDGETPEQLRAAIVAAFERGFNRKTPAIAAPPRAPAPPPPPPYVPAIDEYDLLPDAPAGWKDPK